MNKYFDWASSLKRFVRFDSARAEDVNDALDELSAGMEVVDADITRAIKLPEGTADQTLALAAPARANKVLIFDATGNIAVSLNDFDSTRKSANDAIAAAAAALASEVAADASEASALASEVAAAEAYSLLLADFAKVYLGPKAADPATDNDGNPLALGALYFKAGAGMRVWEGGAWAFAYLPASAYQLLLVSGVNLKTVGGTSLLGSGNVPTRQPNSDISQHTVSGTFVVPDGVYALRPYAFGAGADGTTTNGGGGGGCAYGDISVTPGQSVAVSIASGVAKVSIAGVDLLTANPASGTTGGTASKHASVANGGAYAGGSAAGNGGAASGSPLGIGGSNTPGGGAWGGRAVAGSNSGVGIGPALPAYQGGNGLEEPSMDPLLRGLTGPGGVNGIATGQHGAPGQPGGGGGQGNGAGIGGAGGFGAGSGVSGTSAIATAPGGFGGGGAANNVGGGTGGAGGYGGGGGKGISAGGAGGAAVVRIYY